jgi:hypothetical protein
MHFLSIYLEINLLSVIFFFGGGGLIVKEKYDADLMVFVLSQILTYQYSKLVNDKYVYNMEDKMGRYDPK